MKCDNCNQDSNNVYLHCKNCFEKDESSSLHSIQYDGIFLYAYCGNCGKNIMKIDLGENKIC